MLKYRGIHEKGSGDVVSDFCYAIYNIYLSLCTWTAETTSPEPFSWNPLYNNAIKKTIKFPKGSRKKSSSTNGQAIKEKKTFF